MATCGISSSRRAAGRRAGGRGNVLVIPASGVAGGGSVATFPLEIRADDRGSRRLAAAPGPGGLRGLGTRGRPLAAPAHRPGRVEARGPSGLLVVQGAGEPGAFEVGPGE